MRVYLFAALLCAAATTTTARAACKDHPRDPTFVLLEVPEGAPRPADASAFAFIDDATTLPAVRDKVGPPDAATGTSTAIFVWCLPDGSEVTISSPDGIAILHVRHDGKVLYKRKKQKPKP